MSYSAQNYPDQDANSGKCEKLRHCLEGPQMFGADVTNRRGSIERKDPGKLAETRSKIASHTSDH